MSLSAVIGALRVVLGLDSSTFVDGVDQAEAEMKKFQASLRHASRSLQSAGNRLTVGITLPVIGIGTAAIAAARESELASAKVAAALSSMGDGAGFTQGQLEGMAEAMQGMTLFEDDQILADVTANLLTFGNISGEVFERAQAAALDLSAQLGTDLQGSALQVGKALNDPIRGITALSRAGVSFTEQQREQIRAMVEAGNIAGAQGIILGELERQYGNVAEAAAEADPMAMALKEIGTALEEIGNAVLPVIADLAVHVREAVAAFNELSPETKSFIVGAVGIAAAVGPALIGLGFLASAVSALAPVMLLLVSPVGLVIAGLGLLGYAIYKNREKIAELIAKVRQLASDLVDRMKAALVQAVADFRAWRDEMIANIVGGFEAAKQNVVQTFNDIWHGIQAIILTWPAEFVKLGGDLIEGLKQGILAQWDAFTGWLEGKMTGLTASVREWFGINSPSRVFAEIGGYLMDGLGQGIEVGSAAVMASLKSATETMSATLEGAGVSFDRMGRWMVDMAKGATTMRETVARAMDGIAQSLGRAGLDQLAGVFSGSLGKGAGGVLTGILGGLMGFAGGGQFEVGGTGGIDSQVVAFRASPNETVSITKPGQGFEGMGSGAGGAVDVRVFMDETGNLQAVIERVSGNVVARAAPRIVQSAVASTLEISRETKAYS